MALPTAVARLALTIVVPELIKLLKKAAADPRTREQATALISQIRSGVGDSTPGGRARARLLRDLDATVSLTRGRLDSARDDTEREQALGWLREAEDIRHTADIAAIVGKAGNKELVEGLQARRHALLLRMLEATVPDSSALVGVLFGSPDTGGELPEASDEDPAAPPPQDCSPVPLSKP